MSTQHEEEALGKAYDSRLMRRLLGYLRPYRWRVVMALALVAIVTPLELAPPLLFRKAIDTYFVPAIKNAMPEGQAWRGIEIISIVFLLVLIFISSPNTYRSGSCSGSASKPCTTCAAKSSAICSVCR